jgi:hypothetical protein
MGRGSAKWLVALALLLIAGCGGESEQSASTDSAAVPTASMLIRESDLPPGEIQTESIPESCSPILLLEEQDVETVGTPLFRLGADSVAEVVGVAASPAQAEDALEELHSQARLSCIQATIESFGMQPGESVEVGQPESTDAADEGSKVTLTVVDSGSSPTSTTTLVSMRAGRCVATLLFVGSGQNSGGGFVDRLAGNAQKRVESADSNCG